MEGEDMTAQLKALTELREEVPQRAAPTSDSVDPLQAAQQVNSLHLPPQTV